MFQRPSRRQFLKSASMGSAAALGGGLAFLSRLPAVSADDAVLDPGLVQYSDHIEPLVRLIEETSRDDLLERVASRIHGGTTYPEVLAALLLAGVRNVQPYPSVGFKFHAVLVVNSCHLASLHGPDEDRWLPIFWAIDHFKSSQADEAQSSGWRMSAVRESQVPAAEHAPALFIDAMDRWDLEQADAATAGLVRTAPAEDVFNLFATYAARDFRSIGHKAIYLANAWRTLQVIGWEYAEPVLRSLASAMLNHEGDPNPAESDLDADRPWRNNAEFANSVPPTWLDSTDSSTAGLELVDALRGATPNEAAQTAVGMLAAGANAQTIWDGVFLGAGEVLMRQPGIVGLHGLTTANAVHYLWQNVRDESLRKQMLLQACSFDVMFRNAAANRGELRDLTLDDVVPAEGISTGPEAIESILADISSDPMQAAGKVRAYLAAGGDAHEFLDAARIMVFLKGNDAHDYKFASAVLEDFEHVSPAVRDQFLATAVFQLNGSGSRDSDLVERTRAALSNE